MIYEDEDNVGYFSEPPLTRTQFYARTMPQSVWQNIMSAAIFAAREQYERAEQCRMAAGYGGIS